MDFWTYLMYYQPELFYYLNWLYTWALPILGSVWAGGTVVSVGLMVAMGETTKKRLGIACAWPLVALYLTGDIALQAVGLKKEKVLLPPFTRDEQRKLNK